MHYGRIAATFILNDDVDGAEAGLDKGNSSYHKVCYLGECGAVESHAGN